MKRYRVTPSFVTRLMREDRYITRYILPGDILTMWDTEDDYHRMTSSRNAMTIIYITSYELSRLEEIA